MNTFGVLIRPLLSEKSHDLREHQQKYSFQVDVKASKIDVKKAVEKFFGVKVVDVNTSITRGKMKRRGMHVTKSPNTKKAIVKLEAGQKLSLFDDV